jgi:pimeloyl-ACP methyl ester carboxylesterase
MFWHSYLMLQTSSTQRNLPAWLGGTEYPFPSRYFQTPSGLMHYLDEGERETLIFVHGNPSWSFEYRLLIANSRETFRCIAADHMGFPRVIIGERDWLVSLWRHQKVLSDLPSLLLWGMKDPGLSGEVLAGWESGFPRHTTERYADVGHNVSEELADRPIAQIERFLAANVTLGSRS